MKALVICSGGLVSVTLAHKIAAKRSPTDLVSLGYGQRYRKESGVAQASATRLSMPLAETCPATQAGSVTAGAAACLSSAARRPYLAAVNDPTLCEASDYQIEACRKH